MGTFGHKLGLTCATWSCVGASRAEVGPKTAQREASSMPRKRGNTRENGRLEDFVLPSHVPHVEAMWWTSASATWMLVTYFTTYQDTSIPPHPSHRGGGNKTLHHFICSVLLPIKYLYSSHILVTSRFHVLYMRASPVLSSTHYLLDTSITPHPSHREGRGVGCGV